LDADTQHNLALFFVQAEDGIRDRNVTGVQTCALPISIKSLIAKVMKIIMITIDQVLGRPVTPSDDKPLLTNVSILLMKDFDSTCLKRVVSLNEILDLPIILKLME